MNWFSFEMNRRCPAGSKPYFLIFAGRLISLQSRCMLKLLSVLPLFMALIANDLSAHQQDQPLGIGDWFTYSANLDGGYRKTQFFTPHYNTAVFQWDSRVEFWIPSSKSKFAWGPYLHVAGIVGSQPDAWQNGWLGGPGVGFQAYPFSFARFRKTDSGIGKVLGPLRMFAEYNFTTYWGAENSWRPKNQERIGFDYWKAVGVNDTWKPWWAEIWNGLYWQSGNEFTNRYDTPVFANSGRIGIRKSHTRFISTFTPYLALESSRTKVDQYYWDNRLLVGGGLRFAPPIDKFAVRNRQWLTRFVVYGEYMNTAAYYGITAPSSVPRYDIRIGVSASVGDWYK